MMGRAGSIHWGALSITGNFRENNEDRFFVDPAGRFFLVADGMGGQCAGERASGMAVEIVSKTLLSQIDFQNGNPTSVSEGINKSIAAANSEIMALGELESSCKNMGTTVVYLVAANQIFYVGGVGDSRVYLFRDRTLTQLTEDHSLTQALVKAGTISKEDARTHRYRNVLYRYLGTKEGSAVSEPVSVIPQPGDKFVLCSDGVSDGTSQDVIQKLLSSETSPQITAEKLVEAAQAGGSRDNITCVVVAVD